MSATSKTLPPPNLPAIPSATSLQASAVGPLPLPLPASLPPVPCGPAVVHANLSARQAKAQGLMTSGTFGPPGSGSSRSADLQRSLENRLRQSLPNYGSILYKLIWKEWRMPSGVLRSRLRASALRTSEIAPTGWATASARDWKDSGVDIKPRSDNGRDRYDQLPRQANLAGWPTTTSTDALRFPAPDFSTRNITLNHAATLIGWPTALAADSRGRAGAAAHKNSELPNAVCLVGPMRLTVDGRMLTGCSAAMASGGVLNPAHSRWLMGYPPVWDVCAVMAMPSSRSKRRRS